MKVTALRSVLLSYDCSGGPPLEWVGGRIESWDAALVEVTLDDGTTGLGEVGQGIMAAATVPGIVTSFSPYLLGRQLELLGVGDALRASTRFWSRGGIATGVIGALETAWLDAVAKREGVPLWQLLGGASRESIPVYASGGLGVTPDQVDSWAAAQLSTGFDLVKFRAMRDPATTIELMDHVVPRLPSGTHFALDAVQACASSPWSHADAVQVGKTAAAYGAAWFEEPCAAEDVDGYAKVRADLGVEVSGVESYTLPEQFRRLIDVGGVGIAQPDVSMIGGPVEFLRVAGYASAAGVRAIPHIWGSGVQLGAGIHVAAAAGLDLVEVCTIPNPLREALLVEPLVVRDGAIAMPSTPGIGAAMNEEIERRFPYLPGRGHVIC